MATVFDVLADIQKASGRGWTPLTEDDRPIGALEGFDSLNGLEATVQLEQRLGCRFGVTSVFVTTGETQGLRVRGVVKLIEKYFVATRAA